MAFERIAMPDLDERAIAEQAEIARAASQWMIFVGSRIGDLDSYFDRARRDVVARTARR